MIKLNKSDEKPKDSKLIVIDGDDMFCYFADDDEYIKEEFDRKKQSLIIVIHDSYDAALRALTINKQTFRNLQAASIAGIGYKGKTSVAAKAEYKEATETYFAIQDKRDDLLQSIQNATTIEELEAIVWES